MKPDGRRVTARRSRSGAFGRLRGGRKGAFLSVLGVLWSLPARSAAAQDPARPLTEPDLPGGAAAVFRWLMQVPQPIQIGGAVLGALLAIVLVVLAVRNRREIRGWIGTRRRAVQAGLLAIVGATVVIVAAFSYRVYDYTQHDNDFCTACHVMATAYERFVYSEHADLLCHDCHQQPLTASMRQLYLWVLERPEEIGPHAPVPDGICVDCHVIDDPEETWQRVAATVGHRVHLESDERELTEVMCVTCHGQAVHEFVPADRTCGQAGCHEPAETRIVLGRMTEETGFHCVVCHEFTALAPEEAARDTLFAQLRPGEAQCFTCHDMRALLAEFEPARDPHRATCGICHDPHKQETPVEAFATCTGAGCHERPAEESPFHRGVHEAVLRDCAVCHPAHDWVVEGTDCTSCHPAGGVIPPRASGQGVSPRGGLSGPPGKGGQGAVRLVLAASSGGPRAAGLQEGAGVRHRSGSLEAVQEVAPSPPRQDVTERPFVHEAHRAIECTTCHRSERRHGEIVVGAADCFSCHHTSPVVDAGCLACHVEAGLAGAMSVPVEVFLEVWEAPRARSLPFDHASHAGVACRECHTGRTLTPVRECSACHADHHRPERACVACHQPPPSDAHTLAVHLEGCAGAGCHESLRDVRYGDLDKSRNFCLSCHREQVDHEPGERCARCHLVPA